MEHQHSVSDVSCMLYASTRPMCTICAVQQLTALGKKARDGTISIDDMAGGTFTVSNGGVYGSLLSTPIINPPQVCMCA